MSALERILPFLDTYKGRDRFLRLFCYSAKCAAGLIKSPVLASQFDNFSKQLSTSRACFRLLDDVPTIVDIIRSRGHNEEESIIDKFVSTIENVVNILFSPFDHMSWAIEHRIITSNSTVWDTGNIWCWVISLYINLFKIFKKLSQISQQKMEMDMKNREEKKKLSAKQWYLEMTALKCATDLLFAVNYLPKGSLWAQFFNKWQVGALGFLSSSVSLYQALML